MAMKAPLLYVCSMCRSVPGGGVRLLQQSLTRGSGEECRDLGKISQVVYAGLGYSEAIGSERRLNGRQRFVIRPSRPQYGRTSMIPYFTSDLFSTAIRMLCLVCKWVTNRLTVNEDAERDCFDTRYYSDGKPKENRTRNKAGLSPHSDTHHYPLPFTVCLEIDLLKSSSRLVPAIRSSRALRCVLADPTAIVMPCMQKLTDTTVPKT